MLVLTTLFVLVVVVLLAATCRIMGFILVREAEALEAGLNDEFQGDVHDDDPRKQIPPGLDPSVIASLPSFLYVPEEEEVEGEEEAQCSICLCEMERKERARKLPLCRHCFHADCIDLWLARDASCPICRADVWQQA